MDRRPLALLVTLFSLSAGAGLASAHGVVGSGFEAPVPLPLLYLGAGGTVAVTAGWLAVGDATDADGATRSLRLPDWLLPALRNVGRGLGLFALAVVLAAGLAGPQVGAENVATVLFWPVWLKGLGLFAVLFGSPWGAVSPWRTLYAGLTWLEGAPPRLLGAYPARLGRWPAVAGFAALVGVAENLTTVPRSPRLTAAVVAGYALVMLVGALAWGPVWFRRADPLDALYRLLGRVAPLSVADGGARLVVRAPWRACRRPVPDDSTVAFVVLALYTVSFDGFRETTAFRSLVAALPDGAGVVTAVVALYLAGFGLFLLSYVLAVRLVAELGGEGTATTAFAASLLPIAAAYEVAHTYLYVLDNAATLVALSTGGFVTVAPLASLTLPVFWGSQVGLIVVGHLVAVVAAHRVAVTAYGPAAGRRAHAPLVAIMVGYTVVSLWIISQPLA